MTAGTRHGSIVIDRRDLAPSSAILENGTRPFTGGSQMIDKLTRSAVFGREFGKVEPMFGIQSFQYRHFSIGRALLKSGESECVLQVSGDTESDIRTLDVERSTREQVLNQLFIVLIGERLLVWVFTQK